MRFLDTVELILEERDRYKLVPVDYDLEDGVSFGIESTDTGEVLARIAIKTIDGVPIDALNGNYNYDDVYADVSVEGDTDDPSKADMMLWAVKSIKNMGYDDHTIKFDGDRYDDTPESKSDITTSDNEPIESDGDFDPTSYWVNDSGDESDEDQNDIDDDIVDTNSSTDEPTEDDENSEEEDSDEEDEEEDDKDKDKED